jgi:hypothetical protein
MEGVPLRNLDFLVLFRPPLSDYAVLRSDLLTAPTARPACRTFMAFLSSELVTNHFAECFADQFSLSVFDLPNLQSRLQLA